MQDWWRGATVYQIYPRSFQDDNGDGIGDLPGITRRLDHVASMGLDAIWLSPFFTSPMADMGYDVSNYTDVDPLFGTLADFDALIARAHALDIKIIIDQVLSHSSDQHPYFQESKQDRTNDKADWYVWADPGPDGMAPNNWPSHFGGPAWEWNSKRRQYYQHNFLTTQPDWNVHHPDVQDFLIGTMRFWLERGVDGFRLDTVNYFMHDRELRSNPPLERHGAEPTPIPYDMQDHIHSKTQPENIDFLKRLRALTDEFDARTMVGEVGESQRAIQVMADYTKGDDRLHMAYSFDMLGPQYYAAHFRGCIEGFFAGAPDGWPSWSFSNHDVMRHVSRWMEHAKDPDVLAKQAVAMLASFEGTIGIYQGEELGQTETEMEFHELTDPPGITFWPEHKGRDGCRTPMVWDAVEPHAGFSHATPWLPVKAPQAANAVAAQEMRNDSVLHAYRETLAFRKSQPVLVSGKTQFIDLPEPILAFHRTLDDARMTCVFNLSPDTHHVALSDLGLDENATIVGPDGGATLADGQVEFGPNGFVYLA